AGLAVLLSSIGLYGIVATSIGDRVRDLGLRIALGASPRRTFIAAAWPGLVVSVAGIGAGMALARPSAVLVRTLIWGVQPADPVTFAGAALVGLAIAALAIVIPTMRVLSLNPVEALRSG
ncbi:MAG TPA: FtsX-like permease family protein, partial [Vicinamibacterales bacterium]